MDSELQACRYRRTCLIRWSAAFLWTVASSTPKRGHTFRCGNLCSGNLTNLHTAHGIHHLIANDSGTMGTDHNPSCALIKMSVSPGNAAKQTTACQPAWLTDIMFNSWADYRNYRGTAKPLKLGSLLWKLFKLQGRATRGCFAIMGIVVYDPAANTHYSWLSVSTMLQGPGVATGHLWSAQANIFDTMRDVPASPGGNCLWPCSRVRCSGS